jgi:hypothetical protein
MYRQLGELASQEFIITGNGDHAGLFNINRYKVFQLYFLPISSIPFLRPLLAETPPAIHISLMPVSRDAFLSLFSSIVTILCCIEAQISGRLFSMNCFRSSSVAKNSSLYRLIYRHL